MVNLFRGHMHDPRFHSLLILGVVLFVMLCTFVTGYFAPSWVSLKFYWMTAAAFMLFYAVFSSIASLATDNFLLYWGKAMYSYMALAAAAGFLAYFFSGISIYDAGSMSWLYVVVTIVYLVFMSLVRTLRIIVEFAQKEEWNSPNLRKKKK
jgi:hypothetical protein